MIKYDETQFHLRLNKALHEKIKSRAKANNRSINTEIILALEASFIRGREIEDVDERIATMISDKVREVSLEIIKKEKTRS